ncbi:suppressor protein SRP40 [Cocos nucifera]|uniref:Suppressor protein SRP40 n=1 Tax=Cocos nucifera TaxID=13894 RepID=A0A8K0IDV1_COCNU|nr:suppressor protein SRP40 [Cocos nucifera]
MVETHTSVTTQEEGKERRKDKEAKEEEKKKKKRSLETSADGVPETLDIDRTSNGGGAARKGKGGEMLLRSIAAFLESNGFSKTLSAFQSEAQLEMEGWKSSVLNFDDLLSKCLELSKGHAEVSIDWLKEKDSEKVGISTEAEAKNIYNVVSEQLHKKKKKKKKKKSDDIDDGAKAEISKTGLSNSSDGIVGSEEKISKKQLDELLVKSKEKKKERPTFEDCSIENTQASQEKNLKELMSMDDITDLKKLKSADGSYVETKDKKRKKKLASDSLGENAEKNQLEVSHGTVENNVHENQLSKPHENEKEKRKKKHKMVSDSSNEKLEPSDYGKSQEVVRDKLEELKSLTKESTESTAKLKDEKRKRTKEISNSLAKNIGQSELEASQNVTNKKSKDSNSAGCECNTDSKLLDSVTKHAGVKESLDGKDSERKKKRKGKSTSESAISSDPVDGGSSHEDLRKSDAGKENVPVSEDNVAKNEKEKSKKRKRLACEENGAPMDKASKIEPEVTEDYKETGTLKNSRRSLTEYEHPVPAKTRKTEENRENTKSSGEKLDGIIQCKDNLSTHDSQKEVVEHEVVNGNGEEKAREGGNSSKSIKKEKNSAELKEPFRLFELLLHLQPKTVNAFQRVKVDEVQFTDKRLQDNSYWAKDGAENGYGAKAQNILGQVRGRSFARWMIGGHLSAMMATPTVEDHKDENFYNEHSWEDQVTALKAMTELEQYEDPLLTDLL